MSFVYHLKDIFPTVRLASPVVCSRLMIQIKVNDVCFKQDGEKMCLEKKENIRL